MSISVRSGVQRPPAGLIERFRVPIVRVVQVWVTLANAGLPVEITSWYRPSAVNAATQGKTYSQHLVGTAMDAVVEGYSREQLLPIVQRVASRLGVTVPTAASETSGRSVHVQGLPSGYLQDLAQREPSLIASAESFVGPPRPIV